jgi:hypothetical protein
MAADLRERVARALALCPSNLPGIQADALIRELGLTQAEPAPNWCPECGRRPRDPIGVLGCRNGFHREEATPQPQPQARPQASAEDVARIDDFIKIRLRCSIYGLNPGSVGWANEAWQRIRASLGVVK